MAPTIESLKSERAVIKRKLTMFEKFVEALPKNSVEISDKQKTELGKRYLAFGDLIKAFDTIQTKLECESNEPELEYAERESFDARYYSVDAEVEILLREKRENATASNHSIISNENQKSFFRLPAIDIPKFGGSHQTWIEFRDTFESLINKNDALQNIQKFHYLKASLVGKAAELLKTQTFSAENYNNAWTVICKRYNDKRGLIRNHINALFSVDHNSKETSVKFRKIIDNTMQHVKFLRLLVPEDKLGEVIIIHHLVANLDSRIRSDWEESKDMDNPPTITESLDFLELKASISEAVANDSGKPIHSREVSQAPSKPTAKHNVGIRSFVSNNQTCQYCKDVHLIFYCEKFKSLPVNSRINYAKENNLCSNCFYKGHNSKNCKSRFSCRHCKGRHHSLLHLENSMPAPSSDIAQTSITVSDEVEHNLTLSSFVSTNVLLSTAVVKIADTDGKIHLGRVLLDSGSQSNYITTDLFTRLRLHKKRAYTKVMGLMDSSTNINSECDVTISAKHNEYRLKTSCLIIPKITGFLPSAGVNTEHLQIPANITLADMHFMKPGPIDILLGAGCFYDLLCVGQISLGPSQPKLQKTRFGWIVSGPISRTSSSRSEVRCNFSSAIQDQLSKFWEIEEIPHKRPLSLEEEECENHFVSNTTRNSSGRFVVCVPLKNSPSMLGDSLQAAKRSFLALEKRLHRNERMRERYVSFMREYIELGHMSPSTAICSAQTYYLPHHCVLKEDSISTKLRVVFNGSAPSASGYSINDLQMVGPTLQRDLLSILLSFRSFAYVISADIEKMYRQVLICPSQRSLQRILWRERADQELKSYDLNTVTYGTAAASFLAIRSLFQIGLDCKESNPEISKIICKDFYVDDLLTGCDSLQRAQTICVELPKMLSLGCFRICKWISNDPRVLMHVDPSDIHPNLIQFGEYESTKTLGLSWKADTDYLIFSIPALGGTRITKRLILSETAQIFDPLGLLSPCTIVSKLILQQLWLEKLNWDESIPVYIHQKWLQFRTSLANLSNLKIPRHVICQDYKSVQLHGFSDASSQAYGASVYLRSMSVTGHITCHLLCSKARVSPLKSLTIPRLELCGSLLLARLVDTVLHSLDVKINSCYLWTDSTIVLGWINTSPHLLKTFVAHRVTEIQALTKNATWLHVPTAENPSDLLSRGISPMQMGNCTLWWTGPRFLLLDELSWPNSPPVEENLPELKPNARILLNVEKSTFPFARFSNFTKLERTIAYCLRFMHNASSKGGLRRNSFLSMKEIDNAHACLMRIAQSESFPSEIKNMEKGKQISSKSSILNLTPFIDNQGIIRVGGRLQNANYDYEKTHPILLDGSHTMTKLLVEREHLRLMHAGPQLLLASIRERYWPIRGKGLARKVVHSCLRCFHASPKVVQPLLGSLPRDRITQNFPFAVVSTDYAGPFSLKDKKGRGAKISKCYICLFVCLTIKAVHIELVTDLSSDTFLSALRRFVSRRGKPSKIYSDNGTNFVGANSKLKELFAFLKSNSASIAQSAAHHGINWHFNPPYAPHMNGLCEAGVKSVKHHLMRVAGNALLTYEELLTVLVQIESILNSRPLSPLSSDPNDLSPLTPAHFMIGRSLAAVPDLDVAAIPPCRLNQFQRLQQIVQHFWTRWHREYVSELQRRTKWCNKIRSLATNQLVLIKEDGVPPLQWRLGRVVDVHPGRDKITRVASLKTTQGLIRRAASKICPLPIDY